MNKLLAPSILSAMLCACTVKQSQTTTDHDTAAVGTSFPPDIDSGLAARDAPSPIVPPSDSSSPVSLARDTTVRPWPARGLGIGRQDIEGPLRSVDPIGEAKDFNEVDGQPHTRLTFKTLLGGTGASLIGPENDLFIASLTVDDITLASSMQMMEKFAGAFGSDVSAWLKTELARKRGKEDEIVRRMFGRRELALRIGGTLVDLRAEAK